MTLTFLGIESSCDDSAAAVVQDAGYTEIAPGSFTVVGLQRS